MRKQITFVVVATLVYIVTVAMLVWGAQRYATHKTESLVKYAANDSVATVSDMLDAALSQSANVMGLAMRHPGPKSLEDMKWTARTLGLDELNVVDSNGVIVASSDAQCFGQKMDFGASLEFLSLTNSDVWIVSQDFRHGVHNPEVVMKYVGVAFPESDGFIQVGRSLEHTEKLLRTLLPWMFRNWLIGEDGYYVAVDRFGKIVCTSRPEQDCEGLSLEDIGFRYPKGKDRAEQPFRETLFGKPVTCLDRTYANYRLIAVVPDSEFIAGVDRMAVNISIWLLLLFVAFGWLMLVNIRGRAQLKLLLDEHERRTEEDRRNAREIQFAAMPSVFPPFPRDLRHDVFAQMRPARDVGGDFYDFFYVSDTRFAVVIADTSGKGVPAAMFMMRAKTLVKSLVASIGDLGEAMTEVNRRLCEDNDTGMFVTCWIGVVELTDGRVAYVNAGHNPPYVRRLTGKVEQLSETSGLFLGGLPETGYATRTFRLAKGDTLFLYTDGISESENARHEQFGDAGIERCLGAGGAPRDLCVRVQTQAEAHAAGAPQFDDMTTLAFVYRGRPSSRSVTLGATLEDVTRASEFCDAQLKSIGCQEEAHGKAMIAIDEIANNIVSYSGAKEFTVTCEVADFPPMAQITFSDGGRPWNPLTHSDPDVTVPEREREVGGLGIMLVKQLCDWVNYEYKDGRNLVTIRVDLPWRPLQGRRIKGI